MKLTALLMLVSSGFGAAFVPAPAQTQLQSNSKLQASFENELGSQPPLNFWDPLNLVYGVDQERFDRLRYVELKHGRIAMLAILGHMWTASGHRFAGDIDYSGTSFASIKTGIAGLSQIPTAGILQIVAFIGFLELNVMKDKKGTAEFPGDFRNGFYTFYWNDLSEEEKLQKRAIELNNGRAAQMGILGLMVHEMLGGDPYVLNSLMGYPSKLA